MLWRNFNSWHNKILNIVYCIVLLSIYYDERFLAVTSIFTKHWRWKHLVSTGWSKLAHWLSVDGNNLVDVRSNRTITTNVDIDWPPLSPDQSVCDFFMVTAEECRVPTTLTLAPKPFPILIEGSPKKSILFHLIPCTKHGEISKIYLSSVFIEMDKLDCFKKNNYYKIL